MSQIIRGGEMGAIAQNGKELFKQYECFCIRHNKPVLMKQTELNESDGTIVLGKMCPKCMQYIEEGRYQKE